MIWCKCHWKKKEVSSNSVIVSVYTYTFDIDIKRAHLKMLEKNLRKIYIYIYKMGVNFNILS